MTCSVYGSRPFSMLVALLSALAAVAARFFGQADLRITLGILLGAPLLVAGLTLLVRRPVIRVDKRGVAYHPRQLPRIDWTAVDDVKRAPLVEPTTDGLVYHQQDGWRPILLVLRDSANCPPPWRPLLIEDQETGRPCCRIDFTGLAPISDKVQACIQRHLAEVQSKAA